MADHVEVFVQIAGEDVLAGRLWPHRRRGVESQTFGYASEYLARKDAYELDPLLGLYDGAHQTPAGQATFGAFSDCAPDRWGRRLIVRNERHRSRSDGTTARSSGEIDYLLGVRDDLRQGALRFRDPDSGVFLAEERTGVPPMLELPRLLSAAEHEERDTANAEELALLLRGGSSLGGARPKAHILDRSGRVSIAKFPSPHSDEWNVMLWEAIALRLAAQAQIRVPLAQLHEVAGKSVLMLGRFDRVGEQRVGYVSAMTMLGRSDGERGSYLEIAEAIARLSPRATEDLEELWRRIAFSILISNFDDHLRNHGFLRTSTAGWTLSPAFDLNPDPRPGPRELTTAIDLDASDAEPELLMSVAEHFRLSATDARAILGEVGDATESWRATARELGAGDDELEEMEPAFEHEAARTARQLVAAAGARGPLIGP
jgi:serine/threonine-protein kinase HipA